MPLAVAKARHGINCHSSMSTAGFLCWGLSPGPVGTSMHAKSILFALKFLVLFLGSNMLDQLQTPSPSLCEALQEEPWP